MNSDEKFFYSPVSKYADALNVWFCFPAEYSIGMSSLGFLHLFRLLDKNPIVNPERIFTDTTYYKIPLNSVDLISFSFSFEFDFLNIFRFLEKHNISPFREKRDKNAPLIMGGGAVLTANPEPFSGIFDFVMIGDGEDLLKEVSGVLYSSRALSKDEKLEKLSEIEGCYVPSLQSFASVRRRIYKSSDCAYSPIVTSNTAFSDTFLVEVVRGCPFKCNFCMTSHINNPPKYSDFSSIKKAIDIGINNCSAIGLLGALVPANPCFDEICEYLSAVRDDKEFKLSIGSLRADFITPLSIKTLVKCGQKSATIAVESGSQRMRDFINKKLTEEQILNAANTCYENGLDGLKLYGIVGFEGETQDDIIELINLVKKIKKNNNKKLSLSLNSFVPKKSTPFSDMKMESAKSLEKKFSYIKKECLKIGVAFRPCSIAWNEIQSIISVGDASLLDYLYASYKDGATIGAFRKNFRKIK